MKFGYPIVALASFVIASSFVGVACDREETRIRNEAGASGTRVVHARDKVEAKVDESRWSDAGEADGAKGADAAAVELTPLGDTALALGPVDEVDAQDDMVLERQAWSFEGIRGVALRVRLPLDSARMKVLPSDEVVPMEDLVGEPTPPYAAINGGFYDVDATAMGLVVADGTEHTPLRRNGGSGIVSSHDGELRITHRSKWKGGADEALQSIDRIVSGGESLMTEGRRERHTARSGVALGEDYVWLVIMYEEASAIAAGDATQLRSTSFRGVPLWAFARYLVETTGAREALNLDGAVSTQLLAHIGETRLEVRGERGTINALLLTTSNR